jgi:hypothetical protein
MLRAKQLKNGDTVSSSSTELAFQPSLPLPYIRTTTFPCPAYSYTLKTEAARSSETIRRHIQEDGDVYTRIRAGNVGRRR